MDKTPREIIEMIQAATDSGPTDRNLVMVGEACDHLVDDLLSSVELAALNALSRVLANPDTVKELIEEITGTVYDYYGNHYDFEGT